jgi:apolipoprotein N-acyltransferase
MGSIKVVCNCALIVLTGLVVTFFIFMLMVFVVDKLSIKSDLLIIVFFIFISILLGGIFTAFIWNKMRLKETFKQNIRN